MLSDVPFLCSIRLGHSAMLHITFASDLHMGGCQNYGPFWGTLIIKCRTILGTQKGTLILTTTHISNLYSRHYPLDYWSKSMRRHKP